MIENDGRTMRQCDYLRIKDLTCVVKILRKELRELKEKDAYPNRKLIDQHKEALAELKMVKEDLEIREKLNEELTEELGESRQANELLRAWMDEYSVFTRAALSNFDCRGEPKP